MNLKEYKESVEQINISTQKKEQIWNAVLKEAHEKAREKPPKKSGKTWMIHAAPAAACIAAIFISGTVFINANPVIAQNLTILFREIFSPNNDTIVDQSSFGVEDSVKQELYFEQDQHVSMEITEMLSDGITAILVVRYTGLDREGIDWIKNNPGLFSVDHLNLSPSILDGNIEEYGVNWCDIWEKLDAPCTDTAYVSGSDGATPSNNGTDPEYTASFCVGFVASSFDYSSREGIFRYPMYAGMKETTLSLDSDMEFKKYELICEGDEPAYYDAKYLYLSGLSYAVTGSRKAGFDQAFASSDDTILSEHTYVTLEMPKGPLTSSNWWRYTDTHPREENGFCDLTIASGCFYKDEHTSERPIQTFDPDSISRIDIFGVDYLLKEIPE